MARLQTKVAVVTGGAVGIGRACAILKAPEGARVAILDTDVANGASVVAHIERSGGHASFWPCDVSSKKAVAYALARSVEQFGRLDILINTPAFQALTSPRTS